MPKCPIASCNFPLRGPALLLEIIFPGSRVRRHMCEFVCLVFFSFLPFESSLPQSAARPEVAAAGLREGVQALFSGDFTKAEIAARQQLTVNPRSVDALVLLGRAQMARGKHPLAFSSLREALDYSPDHVEALYFMGKLTSALSQMEYQNLAQLGHAYLSYSISCFERIENIDPGSARLFQEAGDHYLIQGELDRAIESYEKARDADPSIPEVHFLLGQFYLKRGDREKAMQAVDQALALTPGSPAALASRKTILEATP